MGWMRIGLSCVVLTPSGMLRNYSPEVAGD
jgi:hypothetical protein